MSHYLARSDEENFRGPKLAIPGIWEQGMGGGWTHPLPPFWVGGVEGTPPPPGACFGSQEKPADNTGWLSVR